MTDGCWSDGKRDGGQTEGSSTLSDSSPHRSYALQYQLKLLKYAADLQLVQQIRLVTLGSLQMCARAGPR